jgi:hypothetical protein
MAGSSLESEGMLGLVRVGRAEESPRTLTAQREDAHILQTGAFLGRKEPKPANDKDSLKGVSRKQLEVLQVEPECVMIREPISAVNSVGIYRYTPKTHRMNHMVEYLEKGGSTTLQPGDVIEFDNYNKAEGRHTKPMHVFRVMNLTDSVARSTLPVAVEPSTNKTKLVSMYDLVDVDAEPPAKLSNDTTVVNDDVLTPVDDSQTSFVTARESLSTEVFECAPSTAEVRVPGASDARLITLASARQALPVVDSKTSPYEEDDQSHKRPGTSDPGSTVTTIRFSQPDAKTAALPKSIPVENDSDVPMNTAEGDAAEEASPSTLFAQSSGKAKECVPKVKDRFRVVYERSDENFLGFARPSWFFGTVTKVITNKKPKKSTSEWRPYTLHFKFDDGSKDIGGIGYPAPDVQVLNVDHVTGSAFAEMDDGSRVLAYHRDMTKRAMGDLVDCLYQGGIVNGACFRGRVAAIDHDLKTCDVSYFDREVSLLSSIDLHCNVFIVSYGLFLFTFAL